DMVANRVIERMRELDPNARLYFFLLKWKTDRSLLKRGVMTYFYNSEPYGMTDQLAKELDDQGYKHGRDYEIKALIYLVGHLRDAIGEILTRPQKVMEFLGELADKMADRNMPLSWTSPSGMPVANRYHDSATQQIEIRLDGKRIQHTLATGYKKEI